MQSILKQDEALASHIWHTLEGLLEGFPREDILELYKAEPGDQKILRWCLVLGVMDSIKEP